MNDLLENLAVLNDDNDDNVNDIPDWENDDDDNEDEDEDEEEHFASGWNEQFLAVLQNDPTMDFFDLDFEFGDSVAIRLGAALKRNTHLQWIMIHVRPILTVRGAMALANGLHLSPIWRLELNAQPLVHPEVARELLLTAVKTIRCLSVSFSISDMDAMLLGASLQGNKCLQNLRICAHNVTSVGAQGLAAGIRQSQIRFLRVEGDSRRDDSEVMKILLKEGVMPSSTIRHLAIVSDECVIDAGCVSSLESLAIESTFHLPTLFNGLSMTSLTEIKLESCGLGNDGMKLLSVALRNNTTLSCLYLPRNHIGDEGVSHLVENWGRDSPIRFMALGWNDIGSDGALMLLRASIDRPAFTNLCLEDNQKIGFDGLYRMGVELPLASLKGLFIRGCAELVKYGKETKSEAAKKQKEARYKASKAFLKGIQENVHLQSLRTEHLLCMEEIQFYVDMNNRGRYLIQDVSLPPAVWCHVMAKYPDACSLIFCFVREQPTLVSRNLNLRPGRCPLSTLK